MDTLKFDIMRISDIEKFNPLFDKCKVYICYSDLNRNNSDIPRSVIEAAISTLYGCPIVGEFKQSKNDFGDHGGRLEIDENGDIQYVYTTKAYGFVHESSEINWEFVDGKEYITCTGLLWTSRYPEVLVAIEEGRPQSMEIAQIEGDFNDDNHFVVSSFVFSALCILGNDVEPCFEDSKIVAYTLSQDDFKREFNLMVQELKDSLKDLDNKCLNQTDDQAFFNSNEKEDETVSKTKGEIAMQFKLTAMQLFDEFNRVLSEITYEGENWWGETVDRQRYYLDDYDENFVYVVDCLNDYMDMKIPYSTEGDNLKLDYESSTRIKYVPVDWEGGVEDDPDYQNFAKKVTIEAKEVIQSQKDSFSKQLGEKEDALLALTEQFSQLKEDVESKVQEIETLQQFKKQVEDADRKIKVDAVFEKFAKHMTKDEIQMFRDKESTFSAFEDFEKEIKSYVCDKVVEDVNSKPSTYSRIGIPVQDNTDNTEPTNVWDRLSNKNK